MTPSATVPLAQERVRFRVSALALIGGVLAAVAAVLRFAMLGWLPLDPSESIVASQAAGIFPGLTMPDVPSPLLEQLQRFIFWAMGAGDVDGRGVPGVSGDAIARLGPAFAGVALVVLALGLTPLVGRAAAAGAAVLFALSPAWTFLGRHLSPDTVAAAAIVGLMAAAGARPEVRRWAVPVAGGLVVAAGLPVITFLLALGAWLIIEGGAWFGGTGDIDAASEDAEAGTWAGSDAGTMALVAFGVTAALAATGLLTDPAGFQGLAAAPAAWIGRLGQAAQGSLGGFWLPLVAYAPVELAMAVVGLTLGRRLAPAVAGGLILWLGMTLVVGTLAATPSAVGEALLPLTLIAGLGLAVLADSVARQFNWGEDGVMTAILLIVAGFGLVQAWQFAEQPLSGGQVADTTGLFLAGGAVVIGVLMALAFTILWGPGPGGRATALAVLTLTALLGWSNGSRLSYHGGVQIREAFRPIYVTDTTRAMVSTLSDYSWSRTRDPYAASVRVDTSLSGPLAWPLRGFAANLVWGPVVGDIDAMAAIRPAGGTEPAEAFGPEAYLGSVYPIEATWSPSFGADTPPEVGGTSAWMRNFLRWYLQRRSSDDGLNTGLTFTRAELFLRAE